MCYIKKKPLPNPTLDTFNLEMIMESNSRLIRISQASPTAYRSSRTWRRVFEIEVGKASWELFVLLMISFSSYQPPGR